MARDVAGEEQPALGRYVIGAEIASGGMATVHLGRVVGLGGFARIVAIKRLHDRYSGDPELVSMLLDEARLAARISHPNVVPTLDVVSSNGEILLVMEYVRGASVARLGRSAATEEAPVPVDIAVGIICGVLYGLHAAHEARTERGEPLGIVHRDVSPQNILVGVDGVPRVLDFGIAKAKFRLHSTKDGRLKGKLRYMAPEQLRRADVDRRTDVYAASVVLWEVLTGRLLFAEAEPAVLVEQILAARITSPRSLRPSLPEALESIVLRGLSNRPEDRFPTALAMAEALEGSCVVAKPREIGAWVLDRAGASLEEHAEKLLALEGSGGAISDDVRSNGARPRADSRLETETVGGRDAAPGRLLFDVRSSDETAATVPDATSARRPRRWLVAAVTSLGAVALTTGAIVTSTSRGTSVPPTVASVEPVPSTVVSASIPSSAPDAVIASAPSAPTSAPSATQRASVVPPRNRAPRAARPGCDPPYFIDSEGHKQYHPKCL